MSEDMGDKFQQIADMLGQNSNTNIPESVKGLLNMLVSSNSTKEERSSEDTAENPETPKESTKSDTDEMADVTRKFKKAMKVMGTANDPKVNLLNAIKPYLNKSRQKKLQNCMKIMKIGSLTKLIEDMDEQQG